jgi:4-alpha-glucanotransferase
MKRSSKTISSKIVTRYKDALGKPRRISNETLAALSSAMGEPDNEREEPVIIVRCGARKRLPRPFEITLEDGAVLKPKTSALPRDLPPGYHTLRYLDRDQEVRLIASPGTCYLPDYLSVWGWSVQLYACRSENSWGIGDFADLERLARWSAKDLDARVLLVNPLQAASPLATQQPSPYFPSSRQYRNLLYLHIEDIPRACDLATELEPLTSAARALNKQRRVDRDAVFKLKLEALTLLWARFGDSPRFDQFCLEQGESLVQFAKFCALAEHHGCGWRRWPNEFRDPRSPAVARFASEHSDRVRFYQWVQWLLDEQLARAADQIPLMQDLPIGVDPDGADAWAWQNVFADGVTVGAPPDEFNTRGQDWGFAPLIPWKLRRSGYEPYIRTIRATLRNAGGLRIDHVMGLFRLFWIPKNSEPTNGAYVRYPEDELLAILALESQRANAYIVGEDLGTVDEDFRAQLTAACVLSYRLLWFEDRPPAEFPKHALAAVTTHDLPTIAGLWTGSDVKVQTDLGLKPNAEGLAKIRAKIAAWTGISETASVEDAVRGVYRLLGQSSSNVLSAPLEDALVIEERPNMPSTTSEQWPNWSVALPKTLKEIEGHQLARDIAQALRRSCKEEAQLTR